MTSKMLKMKSRPDDYLKTLTQKEIAFLDEYYIRDPISFAPLVDPYYIEDGNGFSQIRNFNTLLQHPKTSINTQIKTIRRMEELPQVIKKILLDREIIQNIERNNDTFTWTIRKQVKEFYDDRKRLYKKKKEFKNTFKKLLEEEQREMARLETEEIINKSKTKRYLRQIAKEKEDIVHQFDDIVVRIQQMNKKIALFRATPVRN